MRTEKEEANMKCEDCANYKAKERRPQVGDWVEIIRDCPPDAPIGFRAKVEEVLLPPDFAPYGVTNKDGSRHWFSLDYVRLCSPPSPVTLTLSDLRRELRPKYGDNITLDLAGMKVQL